MILWKHRHFTTKTTRPSSTSLPQAANYVHVIFRHRPIILRETTVTNVPLVNLFQWNWHQIIPKCPCYKLQSAKLFSFAVNKNIIMSSFKSSGNIQKKEDGPYRGFAYWMLISEPIHLAKTARANYWNLMEFLQDSRRKDWFKPKWHQTL